MIECHCPYCGCFTGHLHPAAAVSPWCGMCEVNVQSHHYQVFASLLRQTNLPIGSYLYGLYCNPDQLKGKPMTDECVHLIDRLAAVEKPMTDDLLKLHELLQDTENKAQIVATPDQLEKLYDILTTVAAEAILPAPKKATGKAAQEAAVQAWVGADDEEDDDL